MIDLNHNRSSIQVLPKIVEQWAADPDFPFMISFPRTGSHWLRMIMELYFGVPSLVRIFYYHPSREFTCYHRHDDDLDIIRRNVIYLYRHPVRAVYSQLCYKKENPQDPERVDHWTERYALHLDKWLIQESFTLKKTLVTYEGMKKDLAGEFEKICRHLNQPFDRKRFDSVSPLVTRSEVQKRTRHDPQVIATSSSYDHQRERFEKQYFSRIMNIIASQNHRLIDYFSLEKASSPDREINL